MPNNSKNPNKYCDTICLFKNKVGKLVVVALKGTHDYYEVVTTHLASKWHELIFNNKEELRSEKQKPINITND